MCILLLVILDNRVLSGLKVPVRIDAIEYYAVESGSENKTEIRIITFEKQGLPLVSPISDAI